jgi:hypothetical protein
MNEVGCFMNEEGYFRKIEMKMIKKDRGDVFGVN